MRKETIFINKNNNIQNYEGKSNFKNKFKTLD